MELEKQNNINFNIYICNWLKEYTNDVIHKVLKDINEIKKDFHTQWMLKELYERESKSYENFINIMSIMIEDYSKKGHAENNPRYNALEHPQSYRDVLYDMYIRKE